MWSVSSCFESGLELFKASCLVPDRVLVESTMSLRLPFSAAPTMLLVVAALVTTGRIEVVDAKIRGLFYDTRVGRDHAAETDTGDFKSGAVQGRGTSARWARPPAQLRAAAGRATRGRQAQQSVRRPGRLSERCVETSLLPYQSSSFE